MALSLALSIPIGSWSPYLLASLSSIAHQQTPHVYVAILDASEDPRVKEDIALSGVCVHYERYGKDLGQAAAIGEGWENTQSDLIGWLNVDDFLTSGALETIVKQFKESPETDVVYGQSTLSIDDAVRGLHPAVMPLNPLLERTNIISQPSCIARRDAVEEVGGINKSLTYTMDWDLWLRLYHNGAKFLYVHEVFSHVTLSRETKTSSLSFSRLLEFGKMLRRSQSMFSMGKGVLAMVRQNLGTYRHDSEHAVLGFAEAGCNSFQIVNFTREAQSRLRITLSETASEGCVSMGADSLLKAQGREIDCTFRTAVNIGESVLVRLNEKTEQSTNIKSLHWHS